MVAFWSLQLEELRTSLSKLNKPGLLIDTLIFDLQEWITQEDGVDRRVMAPSAGSVKPADILLTQAFREQWDTIRWEQMLRGRLSKKWRAAYHASKATKTSPGTDQERWGSKLITLLWEYTRSIWKQRNGIVYDHSKEEVKNKELQNLREEVAAEYAEYAMDNFLISHQFWYLFTKKSQEERQKMDYDSINGGSNKSDQNKHHMERF